MFFEILLYSMKQFFVGPVHFGIESHSIQVENSSVNFFWYLTTCYSIASPFSPFFTDIFLPMLCLYLCISMVFMRGMLSNKNIKFQIALE